MEKNNVVKCSVCGKEHEQTDHNCCWIHCDCGSKICGMCGSTDIDEMGMDEDDDEAQYWCCLICNDCGLQGCAMCI